VVWQADVSLEKNGVGFPPAPPGGYYNVFAFFSNYGPSPADVKVTLTVPLGATYVSYFAQGLTCTEPPKGGQGDLVCTGANLGLGGGYEADLFVRFDPTLLPGTVITFPETLTCPTATTRPTQTTSTSVTIVQPADLHAEMSAPASVHAGDTFLTTITLTNRGPGAAVEPRVTYTNSGYVEQGRMTGPADWGCYYSCEMNSIGAGPTTTFAPGATATFTVPITVPLNATAGTLTAKAVGEAYNVLFSDSADGVATASTVIVPVPLATLKLTMSASPDPVYPGDQLTYTAKIANTSNADAQNVSLVWSVYGTVATTCGSVNGTTCTFPTIAAGTTQTVTRTIQVAGRPGDGIDARTDVTATNVIYMSSSHHVELSTTVASPPQQADLAAEMTAPSGLYNGTTGSWTYRVQNHGPNAAPDWHLSLTLPPNTTLIGGNMDVGVGTCTGLSAGAMGSVVTCHGTNLAANAHADLQLTLSVNIGATDRIHASATVSSTSTYDPNPDNNTGSIDTVILTPLKVDVSMTADKTTAVFGERVTQTLTVLNNGPTPVTNILATLTLPAAPVDGISSSGFLSCTGTTSVRCTASSLEAQRALTATISFQAPASAGSRTTQADVSWLMNNLGYVGSDRETIDLQVVPPTPTSDMTITLGAASTALNTGDTVTYTIGATNLGGSPAANVTAELDLPPSLAFVSASPQCSGGPLVTCTAGTLDSGKPATFTVTARALEAGTVKVLASVSTTSVESNNGNNTAAATIVVNAPAAPARRRAARH